MNALAMTEVVDSAGDSMPPDESRTIPVGAGRRSFIVDLVTTPVDGAAPAVVLVAPRAHLVRLWAVDLKHRLGGQVVARLGAGGDGRPQPGVVLVATPTSLLRHAAVALPEPTVLVVDEHSVSACSSVVTSRAWRSTDGCGCTWRTPAAPATLHQGPPPAAIVLAGRSRSRARTRGRC